jgi:hypothetical protein
MLAISVAHNEARLAGTIAFLDTGAAHAKVRLYEGTRAANVATAPTGGTLLAEVELTKPCGTITAGVLTLTQLADGTIGKSGTATWARIINGNGDEAIDCDVTIPAGTGEIKIPSVDLYLGGGARLVSAALG